MSTRTVRGADGTRLRAWSNDGDGVPVLLCNGLGAPTAAWPLITGRDSGFRVVSWAHRGLAGSERPADRSRVRVEDHADDARAVLDAYDMPSATVIGWSLGVNVAFELALEQSSRVRSLLAVAGVPGGSFSAMFAPFGVPRRLRTPAGRLSSRLLPVFGPLLPVLVASLPPLHELLTAEGVRGPAREAAHPAALYAVLHEFSRHDWRWYRHLALAVAEHAPLDVAPVRCPVAFVAGRYDTLVDLADVRTAAGTVPDARLRTLAGTHFVPLQYPEVMVEELRALVAREAGRP
ncbi:Pimeloyl-ACP methyl ester carboxylesterase [Geodermatophilus poikilotrophus]|uniref:Pimeloyl-ACP methyl ester carboxylesterase n=1 Tax=Geodermatophilus poikilotrophus TaxID=1333667 RepID=A0A1H9Z9G4_9ACTN|nr:Pimeloyl-ACP methyl ester carboxylesterase [Geodermatophilus poikilotrophus]